MIFEQLEPTQKVSHRVVARLVAGIARGELEVGSRLPSEAALASQLGVGLSSVREALAILDGLGVLDVRQGSGRQVRGISFAALCDPRVGMSIVDEDTSMLRDIYEVRQALETTIAKLAAVRADDDDIARLDEAANAMTTVVEAGGDGVEEDGRFHSALAASTKNIIFQLLDDSLHHLTRQARLTGLVQGGRPIKAAAEHVEITDAVRARDAQAAGAAMDRHLEATRKDAVERMSVSRESIA